MAATTPVMTTTLFDANSARKSFITKNNSNRSEGTGSNQKKQG